MGYKANMARVKRYFQEIADISNREEDSGYTRLAFSDQEKKAHQWLKEKLLHLECEVSQDAVGNLVGRYGRKKGRAIAFGSHLDTVPHGGLYDGALGVIAGLECLNLFFENQDYVDVPIELICFTGEESNPLGGTFGSRAMAGLIERSDEYEEKLRDFSFSWKNIMDARKSKNDFGCFLELHIEQGNVLETYHKKIGIPNAIAGMLRLAVHIQGRADHAGTTPMEMRKDALVIAADLIREVQRIAIKTNGQIVATVGELNVFPNVPSVVPGDVALVIEIRGIDWDKVKKTEDLICHWLESQEVNANVETMVQKFPCRLSPLLQEIVQATCNERSIPYYKMFSGANHDSNAMSTLTDTGMIFVPSKNGISHHPDEYTSWEDIEIGINTMIATIVYLCKQYPKIDRLER